MSRNYVIGKVAELFSRQTRPPNYYESNTHYLLPSAVN